MDLAIQNPSRISVSELLQQLQSTQSELDNLKVSLTFCYIFQFFCLLSYRLLCENCFSFKDVISKRFMSELILGRRICIMF